MYMTRSIALRHAPLRSIMLRLTGQGSAHVTLRLVDGTRAIGELHALDMTGDDPAVVIDGYTRADMRESRTIPLAAIRSVRGVPMARCPICDPRVMAYID